MAGIVTETNTFSPIPTGASEWERVDRPEDIVPDSALDGFRRKAVAANDEVVFGLYAFAMPAGITVRKAYEDLRDELLGQLRAAMPVDAVFLPLHGAMVAEGYDDAEGDLIETVREVVGPDVKIGVHIDLHCHLTQRMLDHCDALVIYKEYPHTDMAARAEDLYDLIRDARLGHTAPVMAMFDCRFMGIVPTNPPPMRGFVDAMMAAEGQPTACCRSRSATASHGATCPTRGRACWPSSTRRRSTATPKLMPRASPRNGDDASSSFATTSSSDPSRSTPPSTAPSPLPAARWSSPTRPTTPAAARPATAPSCCGGCSSAAWPARPSP